MPDYTQEIHDEILKNFTELKYFGQETIRRLDKINGSVAELKASDKEIVQRQTDLEFTYVKHQLECPLTHRVKTLEIQLASGDHPLPKEGLKIVEAVKDEIKGMRERIEAKIYDVQLEELKARQEDAATKTTANWIFQNFLKPVISFLVAGLILLLLANAGLFLPRSSSSSSSSTQTTVTEHNGKN